MDGDSAEHHKISTMAVWWMARSHKCAHYTPLPPICEALVHDEAKSTEEANKWDKETHSKRERKDKDPPQNILTHLIINFFKYFNLSYIQNVTVNFINFAALFFPPRRLNQSSAPAVAHSSYLYLESEFSHWSPIIFSSSGLSVSSSPFYGMKNAITSQQGQPGDCRREKVRRSLSFPSLINQLIST